MRVLLMIDFFEVYRYCVLLTSNIEYQTRKVEYKYN